MQEIINENIRERKSQSSQNSENTFLLKKKSLHYRKKKVILLGSCYHQGRSLLLSHNERFCIKLEMTKQGAVAMRWHRGEVALLFCVITASG